MARQPEIIDVEFTPIEDRPPRKPEKFVCAICEQEVTDRDTWIVTPKGKTIPLCDSCRFNRDIVGTLGKYALDLIGNLLRRKFSK